MTLDLAPSRRYTIAKALEHAPTIPDLRLALAEWRGQEDDPIVRAVLDRTLARPVDALYRAMVEDDIILDPVLNAERN